LRRLGAVLGPALFSVGDADRVQDAADNVVPNRRQVPYPTTPYEHNGVFLKIVTFARIYAVTSIPFVRRTRATFRSAEFGFLGVVV
jgi:hypothetical protein